MSSYPHKWSRCRRQRKKRRLSRPGKSYQYKVGEQFRLIQNRAHHAYNGGPSWWSCPMSCVGERVSEAKEIKQADPGMDFEAVTVKEELEEEQDWCFSQCWRPPTKYINHFCKLFEDMFMYAMGLKHTQMKFLCSCNFSRRLSPECRRLSPNGIGFPIMTRHLVSCFGKESQRRPPLSRHPMKSS